MPLSGRDVHTVVGSEEGKDRHVDAIGKAVDGPRYRVTSIARPGWGQDPVWRHGRHAIQGEQGQGERELPSRREGLADVSEDELSASGEAE